ncbi:hypothetical protein R9X47_21020 [Wukongibacter baidiensis]|uniref:hypothetical protein n=1 Tax=Wukongibacter baidiensis TaxID=1723361 RepID=UPI003D7FEE54
MTKKLLNFFKLPKIFYIGLIPIIYSAVHTGIYEANNNAIMKYTIENHSRLKKFIPNVSLGIRQGILLFLILTIVWIFLIKWFSVFNKDRIFIKRFFSLGEISVDNIITKLFYIGLIPLALWAYNIYNVYSIAISLRLIRYSNHYARLFISIASYIITLVIGLAFWKIVCELLLVIFRCLEAYYESKKRDLKG